MTPFMVSLSRPTGGFSLGGQFTKVGGVRRVGLARLLPNGWVDTSFMDPSYNQFAGLINHYYNPGRGQSRRCPGRQQHAQFHQGHRFGTFRQRYHRGIFQPGRRRFHPR